MLLPRRSAAAAARASSTSCHGVGRRRPRPGAALPAVVCWRLQRAWSSSTSTSSASTPQAQQKEVLTRDFIFEALYSPTSGYFGTKGSEVICSPPEDQRIQFKTLKGYWDYQLELDKLYRSKNQAWLTPVEIFAPHYSNAIARYILETHRAEIAAASRPGATSQPDEEKWRRGGHGHASRQRKRPPLTAAAVVGDEALEIYEIGGGYGTNALCVLDYLQAQAPDVYARTRYRIVEISGPLAAKQRERLLPRHGDVCEIIPQDALAWTRERIQQASEGKAASSSPAPFILALEVLDNLPHDKILWLPTPDRGYALHEAVVVQDATDGSYREVHRPVQDERIAFLLRANPDLARRIDPRETKAGTGLLQAAAEALKLRKPQPTAAFLPTGMAELVEGLTKAFPRKHHLLFADFDSLPPPTLEEGEKDDPRRKDLDALNAPLVTSRDAATGKHIDHPSYVVNKGGADIFFPVDFSLLRDLYRYLAQRDDRTGAAGHKTRLLKSGRFLYEWAEWKETETRSGYCPLLEDFRNTAHFLASAGPGATVAGAGVIKKVDEEAPEKKEEGGKVEQK